MLSRHSQIRTTAPIATGAYTDQEQLMQLRKLAGRLHISPPARALAQLAGPLRSNFRGRGIEFEEVRKYTAGDDVRNIDWRVTARTGEVFTKQFREERERPVLVLVDQRSNMFFGSRHTLKSVQAAHTASLLAWATIAAGDRLGGLVLGDQEHHEVRPRRSRHAVMELLRLINHFNHQLGVTPGRAPKPVALAQALLSMRRIARPGSLILLISDFADWDEECERQLRLSARHAEINAIQVTDPLEQHLPGRGRMAVSDGESRKLLDASDAVTRQQYEEDYRHQQETLRNCLARSGVPLIPIQTSESALDVLSRYYRGGKR